MIQSKFYKIAFTVLFCSIFSYSVQSKTKNTIMNTTETIKKRNY